MRYAAYHRRRHERQQLQESMRAFRRQTAEWQATVERAQRERAARGRVESIGAIPAPSVTSYQLH